MAAINLVNAFRFEGKNFLNYLRDNFHQYSDDYLCPLSAIELQNLEVKCLKFWKN